MSSNGLDSMKSTGILECDYCGIKFRNRELLMNHVLSHSMSKPKNTKIICNLCELEFANNGLLAIHVAQSHTDKSKKKSNNINKNFKHKCNACLNRFLYNYQLTYHIRQHHFNLLAEAPYCDLKNINQVWFEKVLNTNIIVEIKKMYNNNLLIRRLNENTTIKPTNMPREVIDLRMKYPISSSLKRVKCQKCSFTCLRQELRRHMRRKHRSFLKKHHKG